MKLTGRQLRMARVAIGLSVQQVKDATGLGSTTITRVELQQGRHLTDTIDTLRRFYQSKGIEFGTEGWVRHTADADLE
jgi:transcriptional regulator with XRE-family HTH domain